ncbi:diguanylate cyclase [Marinomonas algarum]|uniref:diguanylate cyclase n=1 Tax=Marinomonas algarum TaxID=2883105 RepID=A0A9X1LBF3_9GAMM|nr:diguanylate cyclase [Marinomonas algarum]MCB5160437.1 diguanylate cyclase [Marinomonas algarum]
MKVLIVDDTNTDRLLLKMYLSKLGYEVLEADNGQSGIDLFMSHVDELDLILMDVNMPGLNGFDTVKRIRDIQRQHQQEWLPIIFLSASARDDDIEEGILAGGDDYLTKPISQKILAVKMLAMRRIADMRRRLVDTNLVLERLAFVDYLTGVASRRAFDDALDKQMALTQKTAVPFVCGVFDLDNFKRINDTFGHDAGDAVLVSIVDRVKAQLTEEDVIGRLGGEEFGLILTGVDQNDAFQALDTLRKKIMTGLIQYGMEEIKMTASVGGTVFVKGSQLDKVALVKQADRALYEAKNTGRNKVVCC